MREKDDKDLMMKKTMTMVIFTKRYNTDCAEDSNIWEYHEHRIIKYTAYNRSSPAIDGDNASTKSLRLFISYSQSMDTIRLLYMLAAIASIQTLGYFDIRFYYFTVCCMAWQAMRVWIPTWTTNVELQVGWYALKGGTTVVRVCGPVVAHVTEPVLGLMKASNTGDRLYLVGTDGVTMETMNVDPPQRPDVYPTVKPEFVIYEWCSGDTSKYAAHCVRFENVEKALSFSLDFKFSGIKFLAPTITVHDGDNTTKYDMSTELSTNNYYICGNRLFDKPFIAWYLNKTHGVVMGDRDYTMEFVDNRMIPQTLSATQALVMHRDSYDIVPSDS